MLLVMVRRTSLLALALGAAFAVPASALAANGGAAPIAASASSGGGAPDVAAGAPGSGSAGASSAQTGGAVPGSAPKRRVAPAPRRPGVVAPTGSDVPADPDVAGTVAGRFPVQGAFTFGGRDARFGVGRPGHVHQGQDVPAASGTPIVAPVAGTVTWKANQPGGAGIYLVLRASSHGRDYVFMHLKRGSVLVAPDQPVTAGQQLAEVGATGIASGPHLHFEIWIGGWQARGGAPIDPLPQLERWSAAG